MTEPTTILVQKGYNGRELIAVHSVRNVKVTHDINEPFDGAIGSVEWFQSEILKAVPVPEYYPDFLQPILARKIVHLTVPVIPRYDCYVKPADAYKRFPNTFVKANDPIPYPPPYYVSEPVTFINEWRLYVIDGKIIDTCWYLGKDEDKKFPYDPPWIPDDYSGAIDIGELEDHTGALIEAHHPYAIGWYGDNHENYIKFLTGGWNSLKKQFQ